jgi:hypothetical protein
MAPKKAAAKASAKAQPDKEKGKKGAQEPKDSKDDVVLVGENIKKQKKDAVAEEPNKKPKVTDIGRAQVSAHLGWLSYRANPEKNKSGVGLEKAQLALEAHCVLPAVALEGCEDCVFF